MSGEISIPLMPVGYTASEGFIESLVELRASLLVSTYQANQLVCVSAGSGKLELSCLFFDRAMGIAVKEGVIVVGSRNHISTLRENPDSARRLDPQGVYDACFQITDSVFTGDVRSHEIGWGTEQLAVINTWFSCLCSLGPEQRLIPRWKPPFVSELAAEDRCHLNGLAMEAGRPAYVTALGETDTSQGWRPGKTSGGCLIATPSGEIVARGFCMPHSPRVSDGRVWMLNSGLGSLIVLDRAMGRFETVARVPGYTRGLALHGGVAFVGLSKIRTSSTFDGVPIAEQREILKCGVAAIDLGTGKLRGKLEFTQGVEQIFDVAILPGARRATLRKSSVAEGPQSPAPNPSRIDGD